MTKVFCKVGKFNSQYCISLSTHFVDILSDQSFVQKVFYDVVTPVWCHDAAFCFIKTISPANSPLLCTAQLHFNWLKTIWEKIMVAICICLFLLISVFKNSVNSIPYTYGFHSIPYLLSGDRVSKVPKVIQVLNWKSLIRQLTARNGDMFNMNLLCPELILAATAVCQLIMIVIRLGCTLRSLMITQ